MVGFVGSRWGRNLFLRSITNLITSAPPPTRPPASAPQSASSAAASPKSTYKTSGGTDTYNALQTQLQRRFSKGLSLGAQYTWAKELGTSSGSNEATTSQAPLQTFGSMPEYGRGIFDIRHTLNVNLLYDLPFGKGRNYSLSGPMDIIAGGWQIGGITNFRSGVPIDVLITRPDIAYVRQPRNPVRRTDLRFARRRQRQGPEHGRRQHARRW